ncbi:hypothetical protein ACFQ61_10155 [Streptomyces sp. NPDC056500]|uniref:hypothetical protein n=1 Tax=Streptomyces sp. NPDC056500 TaxID=3345840 RepID=UPI00369AB601
MEPTQTPEPTAPLSPQARTTLLAIATRLTEKRPNASLDDARRRALALTYATNAAGFLTDASTALEREVLDAMPPITRDSKVTRAEYADQLRAAVR